MEVPSNGEVAAPALHVTVNGPFSPIKKGHFSEGAKRGLDRLPNALRRLAGEREDELLPSPPATQILRTKALGQQASESRQDVISALVAIPVVDGLEVIDGAEDERERPSAAGTGRERTREGLEEPASTHEPGERVRVEPLAEPPRSLRSNGGERRHRSTPVPSGSVSSEAKTTSKRFSLAIRSIASRTPGSDVTASSVGLVGAMGSYGTLACGVTRSQGGRAPQRALAGIEAIDGHHAMPVCRHRTNGAKTK